MLISFIRTVILLVFIVGAVRIMGKRQIGQLQPAELVVTILLSEMAATPMQDSDIPMLNTIVAVLVLTGLEIIMSVISMKSIKLRSLLQGNSIVLVRHGIPDQKQMKRLRYTIDDLYEALRAKDVFDIADVEYAVAETDGTLSVLLKSSKQPVTKEDSGIKASDDSVPFVAVSDGKIVVRHLGECGMDSDKIERIVKVSGIPMERIFLLTVSKNGKTNIIEKER
ncbi:MAG: DUF421 domain-containing protein [Clostridia bacterium]|nr:DUF421 domain-containing protein [Clostridia bacterium]